MIPHPDADTDLRLFVRRGLGYLAAGAALAAFEFLMFMRLGEAALWSAGLGVALGYAFALWLRR